jgi:hypothetical protein
MIHIIDSPELSLPGFDPNVNWQIRVFPDVTNLIQVKRIRSIEVPIVDIFHKPIDNITKDDIRYITASLRYPVVLLDGLPNPGEKRYRMIDGRHRLKRSIDDGKTTVIAYVLTPSDVFPYVTKV